MSSRDVPHDMDMQFSTYTLQNSSHIIRIDEIPR